MVIDSNPAVSIHSVWEDKQVELTLIYGERLVAKYCPDLHSIDSAVYVRKGKHVPVLLKSLDELKDLPDDYKKTKTKLKFLASPIESFKSFIIFANLIGLTVLAKSYKWWCDGTFKSSPHLYYQHYIIHGKYNGWPILGSYSFLSGKTKDLYSQIILNLKEAAISAGLIVNPKVIAVDFEAAAIVAFRLHFPNAKIIGFHFHFTTAIIRNW